MQWPHPLRSLAHRNLRLFFAGQGVSLLGSWMQPVAVSWLTYRLTRSTEMLGLVTFLAQLPVFLLGIWAGSVADRHPRKPLVMVAITNALLQATVLAVLAFTGWVRPWHVLALSAMLGLSFAFEIPARQALLGDLAGAEISNAVAFNSTLVTVMRVLGPSLGGYLIAAVGEGWCFAFNAVSFLAVLLALWRIEVPAHAPRPAQGTDRGQRAAVLEGLSFSLRQPLIRGLLVLLVTSSLAGLSYQTLMPVIAADRLGGGPELLGRLLAFAGAGAVLAAISLLLRRSATGLERRVGVGATLLGLGIVGVGLSRWTPLSYASLVLIGFGNITQSSGTLTLLQSLAPAHMRGRLMGLFTTLFIGATPFGALIAGWAAARVGAAPVLAVGGALVAGCSLAYHLLLPGLRRGALSERPASFPPQLP